MIHAAGFGSRLTLGTLDDALELLAAMAELADADASTVVVEEAHRGLLEDGLGEGAGSSGKVVDLVASEGHGGDGVFWVKGWEELLKVALIKCRRERGARVDSIGEDVLRLRLVVVVIVVIARIISEFWLLQSTTRYRLVDDIRTLPNLIPP